MLGELSALPIPAVRRPSSGTVDRRTASLDGVDEFSPVPESQPA
jgi:hypothetical protein